MSSFGRGKDLRLAGLLTNAEAVWKGNRVALRYTYHYDRAEYRGPSDMHFNCELLKALAFEAVKNSGGIHTSKLLSPHGLMAA